MHPTFPLILSLLLCLLVAPPVFAAPQVVVSLKPMHSLVASVMEGVGEPVLLVKSGASPHNYALRPSEARALKSAQLIVWVGEGLETFLRKPLSTLGNKARILVLSEALESKLLPTRSAGEWSRTATDHDHGNKDLHLWLNPVLAGDIVRVTTEALSDLDPENATRYAANAEKTLVKLHRLDIELTSELGPVKAVPYVVFHDAYQYLEKHFGLGAMAAITLSPERAPGLLRLREIREAIAEHKARCVFAEPQFEPKVIKLLTKGMPLSTAVLDPLGSQVPEGPEAYFTLMRELSASLVKGLSTQ